MISVRPAVVVRWMVACAVLLHLASDVGVVLKHVGLIGASIAERLSIHGETTIPAWYSSLTLVGCAVLLAVIAASKRKAGDHFAPHWLILAITFLALSLDEAVGFHELLIPELRGAFGTSRLVDRAWVVPGAAFFFLFGLAYLRFLRELPPSTRRLFIAGGATFVTGTVGMEMVGSLFESRIVAYRAIVHVEEGLEMLGVIIFTYALLVYIKEQIGELRIALSSTPRPDPHPESTKYPELHGTFAPRLLWIGFSLFVLYATLIPFNTHLQAEDALSKLSEVSLVPFVDPDGSRASVPDSAQNVLLFVPFGVLGFMALERRRARHVPLVALLGCLISFGVETLQLFTVDRSTSLTDVTTNTIGAFLGAAAAYGLARSFSVFLSSPLARPHRRDKYFFLLLITLAVVTVGALQPFSFTLDVGLVFSKLESLLDAPLMFNPVLRDELVVFFRFFLLCIVYAVWFRKTGKRSPAAWAVAASSATGIFLEACQIFVIPRMPSAQDVVVVILASVAGGIFANIAPWRMPARRWAIAVILATGLAAAVESWSPFRLAAEPTGFGWMPFARQYEAMSFHVIKRLLEAFLLYFPMGFLLRYIYSDKRVAIRYVVVTSFVLACSIEYSQGRIEGRFPGVTDVLVGIAGAVAGLWCCTRWIAAFDAPDPGRPRRAAGPVSQPARGGARPAGPRRFFRREAALDRMRRRYLKQAERERREK